MLCGSEAWCLIESEMGILRRTESSTVRVMCGVEFEERNGVKGLMLSLKEGMDVVGCGNSVCWYGHGLRREDGYVLRIALDFAVDGQRKKVWAGRTWMRMLMEKM